MSLREPRNSPPGWRPTALRVLLLLVPMLTALLLLETAQRLRDPPAAGLTQTIP